MPVSKWRAQHKGCQAAVDNVKATLTAEIERLQAEHGPVREALARIVGAFTAGIYCSGCGESLDDGCVDDCVINTGRKALEG